jgi:transmembrane sensor
MSGRCLQPAELAELTPAQAASYWFVRQDAGAMSDDDVRGFEAWLAASTLHRAAYGRNRAVWRDFSMSADPLQLQALRTTALADSSRPRRRLQIGAAIAVACAISIVAIRLWSPPATVQHYHTAQNERTSVTLSDGTIASLNSATDMDVEYSKNERRVAMRRGEAYFQVTKNSTRPFSVVAADRRITALGTQFDVRVDGGRVEVVLLEGTVAVDRALVSVAQYLSGSKQHFELRPGQRLVAAAGEPPSVTDGDAQGLTSWRQGVLVFDDETLADAVNEFNRYASEPIIVADVALRELRFSGVFRIGRAERFAADLQELLPLRAIQDSHGRTLLLPVK